MSRLNLKTILKNSLNDARKIAVVGVGSELKGDDKAGMLVAAQLEKKCKKDCGCPQLEVFFGATAPENLTGEIKKFQPTHLIIIDAADVGREPGTIEIISPDQVGGISFSSHMLPIKVMVDYLLKSIDCKVMIIGIQPQSLAYNAPPTPRVRRSIQQVASALASIIQEMNHEADMRS
jgi:hydrogenase 3 maturation protease